MTLVISLKRRMRRVIELAKDGDFCLKVDEAVGRVVFVFLALFMAAFVPTFAVIMAADTYYRLPFMDQWFYAGMIAPWITAVLSPLFIRWPALMLIPCGIIIAIATGLAIFGG